MKIEKIIKNAIPIALISSKEIVITDVQSALDLIMSVQYETQAQRIALNKEAVTDTFFVLSSGLAGEILQKFINYHVKIAIYGDFSVYTSKPLKDFIYESNRGNEIFFADNQDTAIDYLIHAV